MGKFLLLCCVILCNISTAIASDKIHSGDLCDTKNDFCLDGNISFYNEKNKMIQLTMRVVQAPGPGKVKIWFEGKGANYKEWHTSMTFNIKGHASEIVDHTLNLNLYDDVSLWIIDSIKFIPSEE